MTQIPKEFSQAPALQGFNETVQPLYYCKSEDGMRMGFVVEPRHCNHSGLCHGGALVTFLDNVLLMGLSHHLGQIEFRPTINLNVDFLATAQPDDWIESEITMVHTTRSLGFISCVLHGPRGLVARGSGQFKLPRG